MIRYKKQKKGCFNKRWSITPEPLSKEVALDRLDLSQLPSSPSCIYVEAPAAHTLVHKDSAFGSFYPCMVIDGYYKTDTNAVSISPIYFLHETAGEMTLAHAFPFDIEVICPDVSKAVPARVTVSLTLTAHISQHDKLVQEYLNKVPVKFETLQNDLWTNINSYVTNGFMSVLGNRQVTVEQIDEIVSGETGKAVRRKILTEIEEEATKCGLSIDSHCFTRGNIFDRPNSGAMKMIAELQTKSIERELLIQSTKLDGDFIKALNDTKREIEESDRNLDESRKKK